MTGVLDVVDASFIRFTKYRAEPHVDDVGSIDSQRTLERQPQKRSCGQHLRLQSNSDIFPELESNQIIFNDKKADCR